MTLCATITIIFVCLNIIRLMKELPVNEVVVVTKQERIFALIFLIPITIGSVYLLKKYNFPYRLPLGTRLLGKILYTNLAVDILSFVFRFFLFIGFRDKIAMGE